MASIDQNGTETAVAIDKDKNSPHAVRWAVDNLPQGHQQITFIHVRRINEDGHATDERDIFGLYRGYCARKGIYTKEVILEENDIAKALLEYIEQNNVTKLVVGASTRNALSRKLKNPDVSNILVKSAPDFCSIFVIAKGKITSAKKAQQAVSLSTPSSRSLSPVSSFPANLDINETLRGEVSRPRHKSMGSDALHIPERKNSKSRAEKSVDTLRYKSCDLDDLASNHGLMPLSPMRSVHNDIHVDDLTSGLDLSSMDLRADRLDFSIIDTNKPARRTTTHQSSKELEAEMRRLKHELKQTMNLYSAACKEAIQAKKKAAQLQQLKMEEARKFEEARQAEEAAVAIAEMEKAKSMAAMEAAEKAQKLADIEVQRRRQAELMVQLEIEEKDKALSTLHKNDTRYRKYTLEEIQEATGKFSREHKIGEGGYGPVYKAKLNHTPVAIKVLRPDASQGKKQFHQEVEVLCSMRHPNMVLLLGACPEYGCLVYEYMEFGSLEDRLFQIDDTPPISWRRRFKIATEIATALLFLHQAKPEPLVHRDLKPANILLDRNYKSKISDVGLARLVPPSVANSVTQYHITNAAGTFCYIDPEYQLTGKLTTRSDIYSLGVIFLQMITARPPMGLAHQAQLAIEAGEFEQMLDPAIRDWPVEETLAFAKLALRCTEFRQKDRPNLGTAILPELIRLRDFARSRHKLTSSTGNVIPKIPTSTTISQTGLDQVDNGEESTTPASPSRKANVADEGGAIE